MEIKLDSKLLKAVSGLFLFAISIILMAADDIKIHWLIGLFLMFGAFANCGAWFLDGKKDFATAVKAGFYFLFAIVFFAKAEALAFGYYFFVLWAMIEAGLVCLDGCKKYEEKANFWFVYAGLAALAILLAFIGSFAIEGVLIGLALMFVALAQVFPVCEQFLPKVELNLKK